MQRFGSGDGLVQHVGCRAFFEADDVIGGLFRRNPAIEWLSSTVGAAEPTVMSNHVVFAVLDFNVKVTRLVPLEFMFG